MFVTIDVCVCVCVCHGKCALCIVCLCTLYKPVRPVDVLAPDLVSHFLSVEIDRELARSRSVAALNTSRQCWLLVAAIAYDNVE